MSVRGAQHRIREVVRAWHVTEAPRRFGGVEFRLGKRELGHIHGDWLVDIPFPKHVRDEVIATGEAEPHHILPETGWVSVFLQTDDDVERAITLLGRSFSLASDHRKRMTALASGLAGE
jgi:hypothetical protein